MNTAVRKILIIAGESSGDRHAADLINEIRLRDEPVHFFGIGGDQMSAAGAHLFFHIKEMAFLGFSEVIRHLPFIRKVFKTLAGWMEQNKPDAVIVVDYPGFNLRLARMAKIRNIPVIYYICPQLWAWGQRRVEKIRRYVDLPLVIFRFEEQFYADHGIRSVFVGHPLLDQIHLTLDPPAFRRKYALDPDRPIMGILPGSRQNEVRNLLPIMAQAAAVLESESPREWLVAKSGALPVELYQNILKDFPFIRIIDRDVHHIMKQSQVVLVASGTATLETGYLGTPMVVLYRVSPLTYYIGRHLIRIDKIALANIVLNKKVVPELIQHEVHPEAIIREVRKYEAEPEYYSAVSRSLRGIAQALGEPGATQRAAGEIIRFLSSRSRPGS